MSSHTPISTSSNALVLVAGDVPRKPRSLPGSSAAEFLACLEARVRAAQAPAQEPPVAFQAYLGKKPIKNCSTIEALHAYVKQWAIDHYARGNLVVEVTKTGLAVDLDDLRHMSGDQIRLDGIKGQSLTTLAKQLREVLPCSYGNIPGETTFLYHTASIPWSEVKSVQVDPNALSDNAHWGCCEALIEKLDGNKVRCSEPKHLTRFCERHGCKGVRDAHRTHYCQQMVALGSAHCRYHQLH